MIAIGIFITLLGVAGRYLCKWRTWHLTRLYHMQGSVNAAQDRTLRALEIWSMVLPLVFIPAGVIVLVYHLS